MSLTTRRRRGLQLIAVFKLVKAAVLIGAGLGALGLLNSERANRMQDWLEGLALGHGHRLAASLAERVATFIETAKPGQLRLAAIGAFLYAAVFMVEGIGLALARRWAEYLTVVVTLSFLPFEVIVLVHRASFTHAATLLLNVAVVVYLIAQLRVGAYVPRVHRLGGQQARPG